MRFTQVDLWDEIAPPPPRPFARLGADGRLFTQDSMHHGLASHPSGGLVYVRFDRSEARVDSRVTTSVKFQTIPLDAQGRALVIGGDGDRLFIVHPDASARCVALCERARFVRAAWLSFGFAALDRDNILTLFRYSDGAPAEAIASYKFDYVSSMDSPATDTLLVTTERALLVHAASDGSLRMFAQFDRDLASSFQCTEESGRHMVRLRDRHFTEGGDAVHIDALDEAIAVRDELPTCAQVEVAVEPVPAVIDLPPAAEPLAPSNDRAARDVDLARLPKYTKALVSKVLASDKREPTAGELELLAMPVPNDLRGYLLARFTRSITSVSVYEAWLDRRPVEQNNNRARREGRGSVSIALGTIANGDPIYAVLRGHEAIIVELSHEDDTARTFRSFESWLIDVCMRAEDNEQEHGLEDALR